MDRYICKIKNKTLMLPKGFELPEGEMVLVPYVDGLKLYTSEGWDKVISEIRSLSDDRKIYFSRHVLANADLVSPSADGKIRLTGIKGEILSDGEFEMTVDENVITVSKQRRQL